MAGFSNFHPVIIGCCILLIPNWVLYHRSSSINVLVWKNDIIIYKCANKTVCWLQNLLSCIYILQLDYISNKFKTSTINICDHPYIQYMYHSSFPILQVLTRNNSYMFSCLTFFLFNINFLYFIYADIITFAG